MKHIRFTKLLLGLFLLLQLIPQESVAQKINRLSKKEKKQGWVLLFDGRTSNGWRSARSDVFPATSPGWKILDGVLTIEATDGSESQHAGDIVTLREYRAFELQFDFKLTPGANSGVKYFVTLKEKTGLSAIGLEYQILDDQRHPDAKLGRNGNRTLASLYDMIPARKAEATRPIGSWNTGKVIVKPDHHVEHWLNGVKVLEYERGSAAFKNLVAISKYKVWKDFGQAPAGHILLQDHGNKVSYRNIKIREL
ncbi:3-keto-disaccharide hydrolase [Niabella terrae]